MDVEQPIAGSTPDAVSAVNESPQHLGPQPQQYFLDFPTPVFVRPRRIPVRYRLGAVFCMTVGVAVAAVSIAMAQGPTPRPVPPTATQLSDETARAVWRTTPPDKIFPPTMARPGGEQYLRLGIATPAGCGVLPAGFRTALTTAAPGTSCVNVLRATYIDSTQTVVATVGIVVIDGTLAARDQVWRQWTPDSNAKAPQLMPGVFPVPGTPAAGFADSQRIIWSSEATDDGSFLAYAVTGFEDGRAGSTPAQLRSASGRALAADSPPVQAAIDLPPDFVTLLGSLEKGGAAS